jgi:hypothetical protein
MKKDNKTQEVAWLTIPQAILKLNAAGIKMSPPTLATLIKDGSVDGMQLGNRYFVLKETIDKIVRGEFKQGKRNEEAPDAK